MLIKSLTLLCASIALVHSATIKQRNIPVEVRYDDPQKEINYENTLKALDTGKAPQAVAETEHPTDNNRVIVTEETKSIADVENAVKSVNENVVLPENLAADKIVEAHENKHSNEEAVPGYLRKRIEDNLSEKLQLSPEEQSQALKHLPQPQTEVDLESVRNLETAEVTTAHSATTFDLNLFQEVKEVISNGLRKLRESFKPDNGQAQPLPEQWENLEKAVNEYLEEEKNKLNIKQSSPNPPANNQNFFQNIASGIQNIANNFVQGVQGTASNGTQGQGDEGQPGASSENNQGGFQGFVSYFQGGVNNIVNTISNFGQQRPSTSNTVLGDTGSPTTQSPNLISSFVNNVQQFFGGIQGGSQSGGPAGAQGDTGTTSSSQNQAGGPGQVFQQIGSAINNFIQGNKPPNTSSDTGSTPQNGNFIQNIGNAIQQFNPFRPGQNGGSAPGTEGSKPSSPISEGAQQIGNQIQQLIPGQTTQSPLDGTKGGAAESGAPAKKEEATTITAAEPTPSGKSGDVKELQGTELALKQNEKNQNETSQENKADEKKEIMMTAD